jgi:hypothetical protein
MTTPHSHAPGAGHETEDLNPRVVVIAAVVLLVVLALTAVGGAFLLLYYTQREARQSAPASPLAESYGRQVPPEPRLQADPLGDLRALRAEEDALLHGYAWVDRKAGTVRIPIERAMALLAEQIVLRPGGGQR